MVFVEFLDASLTNSQVVLRLRLVLDRNSKNPWATALMGRRLGCFNSFLAAIWFLEMYTLQHGSQDLCSSAPASHQLSTAEERRHVHPDAGKTPPPTPLLLENQRKAPQKSPRFRGDS